MENLVSSSLTVSANQANVSYVSFKPGDGDYMRSGDFRECFKEMQNELKLANSEEIRAMADKMDQMNEKMDRVLNENLDLKQKLEMVLQENKELREELRDEKANRREIAEKYDTTLENLEKELKAEMENYMRKNTELMKQIEQTGQPQRNWWKIATLILLGAIVVGGLGVAAAGAGVVIIAGAAVAKGAVATKTGIAVAITIKAAVAAKATSTAIVTGGGIGAVSGGVCGGTYEYHNQSKIAPTSTVDVEGAETEAGAGGVS